MQNKKNNKKKVTKKDLRLDEFFAEDRFDEEDEDSVTDDTLEFLCLDDETIESYKKTSKSSRSASGKFVSRYEEDEDDEDYGDEDYDGDDEDDEDYEDDDYDDEDDEYEYDDDREGVISRFKYFLTDMSTLDMIVAMLGIVVIAGVLVTATLFVNAKTIEKQVEAFASVGEEVEGISVIGESGLLAVSESAKLSGMIDLPEEEPEEDVTIEEAESNGSIEVTLNLTSIQSDLKIKFVNKSTGKLISGVPFEVEVSGKSKTFEWKDDDKDGIIYHTDVEAGTYNVTVKPLNGSEYQEYKLPTSATSVNVTDTIAYKKVDVVDEVKSEAEVNVAAEDTAQQDTVVESTLQDTVEWVESTKKPVDSDDNFEEIKKDKIPDPATIGYAGTGFVKMVEEDSVSGNDTPTQGTTDQQKVESLVLNKTSLTLEQGKTEKLSVGGNYSTDISSRSWSSDNSSVASVSSDGTVSAVGAGSANITVEVKIGSASKKLTCNVTVTASQPKGATDEEKLNSLKFELSKSSLSLSVGSTDTLSVSVTGDYPASISWSSGDSKIAGVDGNGKVTAVAAGETTVTATAKINNATRKVGDCKVTVASQTYKITKIEGDGKIRVGETGTVKVTLDPKGGKVGWASENDKIAKIESADDTSAKVKGVAAGKVKIIATCGDAKSEYTVEIVNDLSGDTKTKLKDKDGNQIYVKKDGKYVEATYADYYTADKFYLSKSKYKYTGWQTIDGSVYFFDKDGNYVTGEQVIQGAKYSFGSDGKLSSGSGTMGIDVSKHNGNIDWNAVKNSGVSFVIIRCGYRGSATGVLVEDPMFRSNIKGAKAAGLKVGVYFFCQAVNEVEAVEEASMAVSLVSGYGLDMPIFLDVESANGGRGDQISKETRTAVCKAFCQTVQNSGYSAGIYANKTWLNEKINIGSLTSYKIWLAQYASTPTYTTTRYDMWQYSSKGKISGISGDVDLDIRYY